MTTLQDPQGPPGSFTDFQDRLSRLLKARADVIQKPRHDALGRVVVPGFETPEQATGDALRYLERYIQDPDAKEAVRGYLLGPADAPLPNDWVPKDWDVPLKSEETKEEELLVAEWRQRNPGKALARDALMVPLRPASGAGQVFADTGVGIANYLNANVAAPDVRAHMISLFSAKPVSKIQQELAAEDPQRSALARIAGGAAEFGGTAGGYLAGGGIGDTLALIECARLVASVFLFSIYLSM